MSSGLQQIETVYQSCSVELDCYLRDSPDPYLQMVYDTVRSVNAAFRKGVRRGLGMKSRDSLQDRLECFQEASDKIRRMQLLFLKRSIHAKNELVQTLVLLFYKHRSRFIVRGTR